MAAEELWYFAKDHLMNTPSRKCGIDPDKELSYRQQAANFIQDMGQRLNVNQLCINTAIVYMHRFYMFHPFTKFHRNSIATCALFLAAKVEEQPRKLEHVIRVAHMCLHRDDKPLDAKSEAYLERAQELVGNENIMLPTLGFDVAIDHPHTHVVKCCQLVRASKDLAQTSYFMATNSLHLTTMCLQYKPTVVACVCIHLACKWANWEIRRSSEGKDWFWYVDKNVTSELLEELTAEFLAILDKCPSRLKRKIKSATANKSDKDGTSGKKSDDPSGAEEYTMADMNQYHDLRIDRADWKEVTKSSKSGEKAKANEERKAVKIEPGLVPPSPQFPLNTPSPQKTDQPLPVTATDSTDAVAESSTPSPSMHKKQKLSTPKQSREKKDAERREMRERERVIAQTKQNIKTEKERTARLSNQHVDAVVASVSSGEIPKSAVRPPQVTPVPTHPVVSAPLNNNHKQHDPALERRKNVQLPGSGNDWKDPSVRIENSHANGRHVAVTQQQQQQPPPPLQTQVVTQPMQQHGKESDSAPQSLVQSFNLEATSNTDPSQMKHREHRSHGSRSVGGHHHPTGITTKVHVGQVHGVDAKEKDKAVKHHRSKTPPAALMELGHQPHQPFVDHQHQFLPVSAAAFGAQVKQEPRVPLQMPNFHSPNGGGASVAGDNNQMDLMLQNLQPFSNVDSNDNRSVEKPERKEKHKHKNRVKERSKARDRDKEYLGPGVASNPGIPVPHQGIKLTIPKDKLGCDDDAPEVFGSGVASHPMATVRTTMLPVPQHPVPSLSHHVHQSSQGPGPSPPKAAVGGSLKIKIPKEKLLTPKPSQNSSGAGVAGRGGLKITISKARLNAASAFQVLDSVVPGSGGDVPVAPPPAVNAKESRKRAASNKDVASAAKPKVARQAARFSKTSEQTAPTLSAQATAPDMNVVASSQMSNLTPFQASLMTTPEASLRAFQIPVGQGYNHGGMMMPDMTHDAAPKMAANRRGAHSKRGGGGGGGIAENVAAMPNVFHQMNAGPYPYQQFYPPHYQNHYFHQPHVAHPQSDFRYFPHNRPPMPPPLPSGPPPEAPPPPPPPPLHE